MGSFRSRHWDPRPAAPCHRAHPPSPECTTHLQIGLVSVPHPGPTFPGAVPACGQGSHQQRECWVQGGVLGVHQEPHALGPGVLRVRGASVGPRGDQQADAVEAGLGRSCYLYHPLQATQRGLEMSCLLGVEAGDPEVLGGSGRQGDSGLLDPSRAQASSPPPAGREKNLEITRNLERSCVI